MSHEPKLNREGNVRIKSVTTLILGVAVLVACAAPAMAQARPTAPPPSSSSSSSSSGDFGIGYSFLHIGGASAAAGFDAFYTKDVSTMSSGSLGYVVDFSVNHSGLFGTGELATGGVRANFKSSSKAKFYGQATGGFSHFPASSQLVIDFGGGVDYPLQGQKFDLFVQADFPIVFFTGAKETGFRLNVGITMPVGK
jgi:hypothetical protein